MPNFMPTAAQVRTILFTLAALALVYRVPVLRRTVTAEGDGGLLGFLPSFG